MQHPRIAVRQVRGVTVAELLEEQIDRLDTETVEEISGALLTLVPKGTPVRLLVSFGRVSFMGSTLLGTLIRLSKRTIENKGALKLCSLNPSIKSMFALVKLDLILDICPDEQSALDSFGQLSFDIGVISVIISRHYQPSSFV